MKITRISHDFGQRKNYIYLEKYASHIKIFSTENVSFNKLHIFPAKHFVYKTMLDNNRKNIFYLKA